MTVESFWRFAMTSGEITSRGFRVLRSAFEPLRCVAELYDCEESNKRKARFRVFNQSDEALLRMEGIEPFVLRDRRLLSEIIEAARNKLVGRGVALRAWSMPLLSEISSDSKT
jgi:hypothetical protein